MTANESFTLSLGETGNKENESKLLGITSYNKNTNEIVITTKEETMLYNIEMKSCRKKWTYRQGNESILSLPVVRDSLNRRNYSVKGFKHKSLISWDDQTDSLLQKALVHVNKKKILIQAIYVHPLVKNSSIYLYNNGDIIIYDLNFKEISSLEQEQEPKTTVEWSTLVSSFNDLIRNEFFVIQLVHKKKEKYQLKFIKVTQVDQENPSLQLEVSFPLNKPSNEAFISSIDFNSFNTSISFLWSTGQWEILSFNKKSIKETPNQRIYSINSNSSSCSSCSCTCSSSLLCINSSITLISLSNGSNISLWNSNYGIVVKDLLQEQKNKKQEQEQDKQEQKKEQQKKQEQLLCLSLTNQFYVLGFHHKIVFIPIEKTSFTSLVHLVGIQEQKLKPKFLSLPSLQEEIPFNVLEWNSFLTNNSKNSTEEHVLEVLLKNTTKEEQFLDEFHHLSSKKSSLSHYFILQVVNRCLKEEFWKALTLLIQTRRLSSRSCPQLIPVLIEKEQINLLKQCLVCVLDLAEQHKIQILHYFITKASFKTLKRKFKHIEEQKNKKEEQNSKKKKMKSSKNKKQEEQKNIVEEQKNKNKKNTTTEIQKKSFLLEEQEHESDLEILESVLNIILSLPKNDIFLLSALQLLSLEESLFLLSFLKKKISSCSSYSSYKQLISWIIVILDSHFTQVVLPSSLDSRILFFFKDLQEITQKTLEKLSKMAELQGTLDPFLKQTKLPIVPLEDYSIEILYLH